MKHYSRHFYISNNLDDLESLEVELEAKGVSAPQIHVYSQNAADASRHKHLHKVSSLLQTDAVSGASFGAMFGMIGALLVLFVASITDATAAAGWMPFIFLAVVVFGFCTWEGGLFGIQRKNHHFEQFEKAVKQGNHVFFVDVEPEQEPILEEALKHYPRLSDAGRGEATPDVLMAWQRQWHEFRKVFP